MEKTNVRPRNRTGMMMMASCSDEENFDPGGSTGKETPEPTEKAFLSMRLSTGSLAGTRVAVDPTTSGRTERASRESCTHGAV